LCQGRFNGRLAAVRRLAYEAADTGLLSDLAAGIRRVKGPKNLGVRLGNWLTTDQARALWQVPDPNTLKGKRDRALLGPLLGLRTAPERGSRTGCRSSSTQGGSLGDR
jgi:site-specific recombinase XerD